jgi:L-ascorbate metabolism protein UlaG (beta-lactamase superfamily)
VKTRVSWAFTLLAALLWPSPAAAGLAKPDGVLFPVPPRDALTFWGHACCYVDVDGYGIVTDPVFQKGFTIEHRHLAAPPPASYRGARLVLVSHAHPDHLDKETLKSFPAECTILCPAPSAPYLKDLPQSVRTLRPGDVVPFPGGCVIAVAARHAGGRRSNSASDDGRALGYVIETPGAVIYYAGDTEYFAGIDSVASAYHPDIALLNMNGHLHGLDAVHAFRATGASRLVPMHFGVRLLRLFGAQAPARPRGARGPSRPAAHAAPAGAEPRAPAAPARSAGALDGSRSLGHRFFVSGRGAGGLARPGGLEPPTF